MAQYIKKLASGGTADEPELQVRTLYGAYDAERLLANLDNPHNEEVFLNLFTRRKDREHAMAAYTAVKLAVADGSLYLDKDTRWYGNGISDDRFIGYAINFTKLIYNLMTPIKRSTKESAKEEEKAKTKFNADTEFGKYFALTIFGGDKLTSLMKLDWQQLDDIDPNNRKVRSNTNRLAWLKEYLPKYRDYLNESTTDYDWGIHKNKESYIAKLDKAIQDLNTIGAEYGEAEQKTLKSIFNDLGMAGNRKLFDVTNISGESGLPLRLLDMDPKEADDIRFENWLKQPENQQWIGEHNARNIYEALRKLALQSTRDLLDSLAHLQQWNEELNRIFNSPFLELIFYTLQKPDFSNWGNEQQTQKHIERLQKKYGRYKAYEYNYLKFGTSLLDTKNALDMSNFLYQRLFAFRDKKNNDFTKIGDDEYLINNTLNLSTGFITKFNSKTRLLSIVRINPQVLKELLEKMKEYFYRQNGFKYILSNKQGGTLHRILYADDGNTLLLQVNILFGDSTNVPRYEYILRQTRNTGVFPLSRIFNDTKDLRSAEELQVGALKIDLSYDDWVELGSALANLISAGLALKNKPTASLIAGAVGTGGNMGHIIHDKSLSPGEKWKYAGSNAVMWIASAIPILGRKFAKQQLRNALMKFAKGSAPFGAYLLATGSPEAAKAAKVIYDRSASGSWDQITEDEINLLLYGLTWLTNGVLFGRSEQIRRNTTTTTKGTNLNVHDEAGNRGKILNINDALRDGIQKATSLESLNLVLREWALANPKQTEGFDPATLLVDRQYMPRGRNKSLRPWKWTFIELTPFESYTKTTATPGKVQQQIIDDEAFKKAWTEGGRGELAAKAAANGTLSETLKADIQRYHKLNPEAPDVDLFLAMHQNTVLTDSNGKFSLLLNDGNKTTGWVVRNNDGGFEFVTSPNKPQNAIVDRVASKAEKDAIKRLLDKLILKYRTFGYDADNIAELQWDFDSYFNNIKISRQPKPKTTKSATKPTTTETTPPPTTTPEPAEGATPSEKSGGKLERLLALKKRGGIVKALPGTTLKEITPAQETWYTKRYPQQILRGFPDQYGKYLYYKYNLLNTHNRGNSDEETNNIWNLASPEAFNAAYTSNLDLVGQDLNTYYNDAYKGKSLQDFVTGYNTDASNIRGFWHYNLQDKPTNYIANERKIALGHNRLFRRMFANRSQTETNDTNRGYNIGYQDDDIESWMGTSTWKRRMDLYEKEFDALTPEEKKKRVHKIGDLGWVYKKANGDIAILSPEEIKNLGLETPEQPQEEVSAQTTPAEGEKPDAQNQETDESKKKPVEPGVGTGATSGVPGRSGKWKEWIKNFPDFRPEILDIARLMANLRSNRKLYDLAMKLKTPLKRPMVAHRNVYTGFDIERAANQLANQLLANAGLARTSDASINEAIALEAQYKGSNMIRDAQLKSDQILRDTAEKQWAVDREVDKYNLGVADFNNAALHEIYNQGIKSNMGMIRSNMDSLNNYLMANETRYRQRRDDLRDKRERYQDKAEEAWLAHLASNDTDVINARNHLLELISQPNADPNLLREARYRYQDAQLRALWKYTLEYYRNKGVDTSRYEKDNGVHVFKKGGTIDDTQVKKRSKDNDRLIKQVIAGLRENSRALDRLSKALLLSIRSILK